MPLYTYRCTNEECKHSIDKIVKYDDRENVQCVLWHVLVVKDN